MGVDVLVIGASVDGLAAAAALARAGRKVLVLEAMPLPGGLAAGGEIAPGYRHQGVWHDGATVRPGLVARLGLADHGLQRRAPHAILASEPGGRGVLLDGSEAELAPRGAVEGWRRYRAFLDRIRPFAAQVLDAPAPDLGAEAPLWPLARPAVGLRRLGRKDMLELLRVGPSCVDDLLGEYFSDPLLRAALAAPALVGTWMGPRSPQSAAFLLLREAATADAIVGGPAALVRALVGACASAGVEIQCEARVARIRTHRGAAVGLTLADGTEIDAPTVISTAGPRETLLGLVDPLALPAQVAREAALVRVRGTFAKVHLALSAPLRFRGRPEQRVARAWLGPHPHDLERNFDDVKHRRLPRKPTLDVRVLTAHSAELAPPGHEVVSIVTTAPYHLDAGWDEAAREALGDAVLAVLREHADVDPAHVVAREVITPADLASRWGHAGGHPLHAELALDQVWALRPTPSLARHGSGVPGLFLASTGVHPGIPLGGGSGLLAADAALAQRA